MKVTFVPSPGLDRGDKVTVRDADGNVTVATFSPAAGTGAHNWELWGGFYGISTIGKPRAVYVCSACGGYKLEGEFDGPVWDGKAGLPLIAGFPVFGPKASDYCTSTETK